MATMAALMMMVAIGIGAAQLFATQISSNGILYFAGNTGDDFNAIFPQSLHSTRPNAAADEYIGASFFQPHSQSAMTGV